jgi:hypothetical protein
VAVVSDQLAGVVLHAHVEVLLRLDEDLFGVLLVLEADLVAALAPLLELDLRVETVLLSGRA